MVNKINSLNKLVELYNNELRSYYTSGLLSRDEATKLAMDNCFMRILLALVGEEPSIEQISIAEAEDIIVDLVGLIPDCNEDSKLYTAFAYLNSCREYIEFADRVLQNHNTSMELEKEAYSHILKVEDIFKSTPYEISCESNPLIKYVGLEIKFIDIIVPILVSKSYEPIREPICDKWALSIESIIRHDEYRRMRTYQCIVAAEYILPSPKILTFTSLDITKKMTYKLNLDKKTFLSERKAV